LEEEGEGEEEELLNGNQILLPFRIRNKKKLPIPPKF
jgi:hypothetical protein